MCIAILKATETCSGRILVLGTDDGHLKNLYSMLIRVADDTTTTYKLLSQSVIWINGCDIVFELPGKAHNHIYGGVLPQRFVDHRTEEHFVLDRLCRLKDDFAALKRADGSKPENTKNRPQYVKFDPVAVGWDMGLDKAIEDAQRMHVPLAVTTHDHLNRVKRKFPHVCVGLIES